MKRVTSARVALIVVLGALVLSIAAFGTGSATHKGEDHGNSTSEEVAAVEDAAVDDAAADTAVAGSSNSKKKTDTGTSSGTTQSSGTQVSGTSGGQGSGKTNPDPAPSPSRPATTGDLTCYANPNNGGGGSNSSGYYDSRCDTSAGDHGNGGNGKCAGCTGKSDWKNPRGQYQNDHNNGYECDWNGGVGKGNPAHSRCPVSTTTTTPPPCPAGTCPSTTPPCPPGTCPSTTSPPPSGPVSGGTSPVVGGTDEPNVCVDNPNTLMDECDKVKGERFTDDDVQGDEPLRDERQPTQGETLPFTGAGVISLLFLGGLMVAGGALVIQRTS